MKKFITGLWIGLILLLPLQTRWIMSPQEINGTFWEYGTVSLYATQLLAIILVISQLVALYDTRQEKRLQRFGFFSIITMLCLALPVITAPHTGVAIQHAAWILLGVMLITCIPPRLLNQKTLLLTLVISGCMQALIALGQWFVQSIPSSTLLGMSAQNPDVLGTPVIMYNSGRWMRSFGMLPHPNMLGGFLALCSAAALYAYQTYKSKAYLVGYALLLIGILTSASRAAILAVVVMITVQWIASRRQHSWHRERIQHAALVTVGMLVVAALLYPQLVFNRLRPSSDNEMRALIERRSQLSESTTVLQSSWITGVGLHNYTVAIQPQNPNQPAWAYQPVHVIPLLMLCEWGLLSLLIILAFAAATSTHWLSAARSFITHPFAQSMLVIIATLSVFDHYLYSFWFGTLLITVCISIAVQEDLFKAQEPHPKKDEARVSANR